MSPLVVLTIIASGLLIAVSVAVLEQVRVAVRRRRRMDSSKSESIKTDQLAGPHWAMAVAARLGISRGSERKSVESAVPEIRAASYRRVLDSLSDELDRDIAEWEEVLQDFPRVSRREEPSDPSEHWQNPTVEPVPSGLPSVSPGFNSPHRTRPILEEERGQIVRLSNSGFAPEEIALWLNLPLEKVQELVLRQ